MVLHHLEGMSAMPIDDFGEVPGVSITILVDNRADLIVKSTETVRYWTDAPLLAEHGFAALVVLGSTGSRILWDTGATSDVLLHNARLMGIDVSSVDAIVLSHGHSDHTGAVTSVLQTMGQLRESRDWSADLDLTEVDAWAAQRRVPLIAHPAAFREGWFQRKDGSWRGPLPPLPTAAWEELGASVVHAADPYQVAPGCWTTGYVPRQSFESAGRSSSWYYREGDQLLPHDVEDDQALVLNVAGKGLVVLAGCAHAGIVNTVAHAQAISGVERVCAVIGGFHLARASTDQLAQTIEAAKAWNAQIVSPMHCTGFGPIGHFAQELPEAFVRGIVGTTYLL
jgi:7,8-dihydropterin-6-yl-methyl-4-(beta-D-ribofuranosyl)aminobenzene 5'-phosphate synthase